MLSLAGPLFFGDGGERACDNRGAMLRGLTFPTLVAFLCIYVIWGSTYLAIRIAVREVPPLYTAGVRFVIAGVVMLAWARLRRNPMPTAREWCGLATTGALLFLCGYAGLFWAETRIASGVAAVLVGTIPVWIALVEITIFQRRRIPGPLAAAIGLGFGGVALLALHRGAGRVPVAPCLAILGAEVAWSVGSVLSKRLPLPRSEAMTAGGQMFVGGALLWIASASVGELSPWPRMTGPAAWALLYMIVAGSLIGFTAYVWLLGRMPATVVSSYAYVNPVVALAIGYFLGHEAIDRYILIGAALVLVSVFLILRARASAH